MNESASPQQRTTGVGQNGRRATSWVPLIGPIDRADFFEEQRRRRREARRASALCALASVVVGVPLSMFVTPFLFLLTIGVLKIAEELVVIAPAVWTTLAELARFLPSALSAIADDDTPALGPWETLRHLGSVLSRVDAPFDSPLLGVAALILPGMIAMVVLWLAYRALFARAGVGGAILLLGARAPRPDDVEEQQLVNLVQEMAIAGGVPAPQIRLLDSPIPNAAAIGGDIEHSVVVVTRGLLDRMNRDETQGIIAHVIGYIGNGDLRVALSITTIFQSVELVLTAFDALFNLSRSAWRTLFQVARFSLFGRNDPRAAAAVAQMLDHRLGEAREDGVAGLMNDAGQDSPKTQSGRILKRVPPLYVVFLPFLLLYVLALFLRMQVSMMRLAIVGPMLMRVWRARRYLADATAVQLTRNPDGLARGLVHLGAAGGVVPGGQWFSHIFVVGPEALHGRDPALRRKLAEIEARAADSNAVERANELAPPPAVRPETFTQELGGSASHPAIAARVHYLTLLGAQSVLRRNLTAHGLFSILFLPLVALAFALMVVAMTLIFAFGVVAAVFFMGMAMSGIHALVT